MNNRTGYRFGYIFSVLMIRLLAVLQVGAQTITPSPYWKNQVLFPDDPFRIAGASANDPGWVKFTILLEPYDPNIVYYQDCQKYTFHYTFASECLDPFLGMSTLEYEEITMHEVDQQAILGTVILPPMEMYPPMPPITEYGIQFIRRDPYSKEEIEQMFNIVKANVIADPNVQSLYFPTYEQYATAHANRDWFEAQGILISSSARWSRGNLCYAPGWALGELKYFSGNEIEAAFLAGDLLPSDILLTDGVPTEIPMVAGIITLTPSTPNSHMAILAQTYGVPFVYLALADDADRVQQLVGHRIVLRAFDKGYGVYDVRLIDVEGVVTEEQIGEILALKEPPELNIQSMTPYGAYSASTNGLLPSDIRYFGGKAANFGILRTSIPDNTPIAAAFSFDLWNSFLDQILGNGKTLREEINQRLSGYSYPPMNMAALAYELDDIRDDLFKDPDTTSFSPELQNTIINTLQDAQYGFDAYRKIRFRSSTNVEDSEHFTGAGLYGSYSGCLADDLDGDEAGPCWCDSSQNNERGVFRAIRKVFASFYNNNAYLERLRYGINENEVGMALLVHHSFPDEIELANGVATLEKGSGSYIKITLVTQEGAVSVTNPEGGAIPEVVEVEVWSFGTYLTLVSYSNLVPIGAYVLDWEQDYRDLADLLITASERFSQVTGKSNYMLDFEYKKVAPEGNLVVKQIREIPQPETTENITPFLINDPKEYCTFQGEYGNVFANHRLKSHWWIETKSLWLNAENLAECLYADVNIEYVAEGRIRQLRGRLPLWPMAGHKLGESETTDSWLMHHLQNPRKCELITRNIPLQVSLAESPILILEDFGYGGWGSDSLLLRCEYEQEVPTVDWNGPTTTKVEDIALWPCPQSQSGDTLQERTYEITDGVRIRTSFYWPQIPEFYFWTFPLARWQETIIEGLTSEPIVLHGYFSQTYLPGHHNFSEFFIFEPRLEPGISKDLLDELETEDIRMIYLYADFGTPYIDIYGFDDEPFIPADLDGDGDVDLLDYGRFSIHWQDTVCDTCSGADLTGDGCVNLYDLNEFSLYWLMSVQ